MIHTFDADEEVTTQPVPLGKSDTALRFSTTLHYKTNK